MESCPQQQSVDGNIDEGKLKEIQKHASAMMEHFDTVHVFCTYQKGDKTHFHHYGYGNWFARYGHVKIWVKQQEAADCERARLSMHGDDDGE